MSEFVEVGGARITKKMLERFFVLGLPAYYQGDPLPDDYEPDLEKLGPHDGKGEPTPEQQAYALLSRSDLVGAICRACATSRPYVEPEPQAKSEEPRSPTGFLISAGFPYVTAKDIPFNKPDATPPKVAAWANTYSGTGHPWLWVIGSESQSVEALAFAACGAWRTMERGGTPRAQIRYASAYDLCGMVDSADQYGEDSRYNVLRQFTECGALFLGNLGEERANQHTFETFARLIAARHRNQLPTAMASATGLQEWLSRYQRIDARASKAMGMRIVDGLGGYESDREHARRNLSSHVVDLGRD